VEAELREEPTADEGTCDSDEEVADDPEPGALHDLAGQPSRNEADHQYADWTSGGRRYAALADLNRRLASGEIDQPEYEEKRKSAGKIRRRQKPRRPA